MIWMPWRTGYGKRVSATLVGFHGAILNGGNISPPQFTQNGRRDRIKMLLGRSAQRYFAAFLFWMAMLLTKGVTLAEVKVTDTGYTESKMGGQIYLERLITIDTGRRIFAFKSNGASIGMPLPVQMNWKMNELCTVWVNGERYFQYKGHSLKEGFEEKTLITLSGDATEARIEAVQDGEQAKVKLLLTMRQGDDKVILTVRVEPHQTLRTTRIGLECFPSTDEPKNKLTRAVATTKRTEVLRPGEKAFTFRLEPEERWFFLHDAVFDLDTPAVDMRKGGGGCALFYDPQEVKSAEVAMANYHCDAYFNYGPEVREMHLLVYDFSFERTNQNAVAYLKNLDSQGVSTSTPQVRFRSSP
jgi:hypothetical protein